MSCVMCQNHILHLKLFIVALCARHIYLLIKFSIVRLSIYCWNLFHSYFCGVSGIFYVWRNFLWAALLFRNWFGFGRRRFWELNNWLKIIGEFTMFTDFQTVSYYPFFGWLLWVRTITKTYYLQYLDFVCEIICVILGNGRFL